MLEYPSESCQFLCVAERSSMTRAEPTSFYRSRLASSNHQQGDVSRPGFPRSNGPNYYRNDPVEVWSKEQISIEPSPN